MNRIISIPVTVVKSVMERDGWRCAYCSIALTRENHSLDHFVPIVDGGGEEESNLFAACRPCNVMKRNRRFASVDEVRAFIVEFAGTPPKTTATPFPVQARRCGSSRDRALKAGQMRRYRAKYNAKMRKYQREYQRKRRAALKAAVNRTRLPAESDD